jgi:hypothetical protein
LGLAAPQIRLGEGYLSASRGEHRPAFGRFFPLGTFSAAWAALTI